MNKDLLLLILLGVTGYLLYKSISPSGAAPSAGKIPPSPPPSRVFDKRSSDYVRWVQDSLNRIITAGLKVDGILGPKTKAMIVTYQGMCGVYASGEMDELTETCLKNDLAARG